MTALVALSLMATHGAILSAAVIDVVVLAQQSPYQVDVSAVDAPGWLEPFGLLQDLPVWAAAAALAAAVTAAVLIIAGLGRLIWSSIQSWRAYR